MSSSLKLSQRIVQSGEHMYERMHKMPYFTKHFIKEGIDEEAKQFGKRVTGDGPQFFGGLKEIIQIGVKKSDSAEDRMIFESIISGMDGVINAYKQEAEKALGKFDDEYLAQPMHQTMHSWKQNCVAVASTGTYLQFLVVLIPTFNAVIRDTECLRNNPNMKDSPFLHLFTVENLGFDQMFGILCSMIDKRCEPSEAEESNLKEIFKRSLTYELMFKDYHFTGREWSGGLWYQ